jgi:hypothetical protein
MLLKDKENIIKLYLELDNPSVTFISEELDIPSWEIKEVLNQFELHQSLCSALFLVPSFIYPGDFYLFNEIGGEKRIQIINQNQIENTWEFTNYELLWLKEKWNLIGEKKSY